MDIFIAESVGEVKPLPTFWHDTLVIHDVNAAACALLRGEREMIIDRTLESLIVTREFQQLAVLRMEQYRKGLQLHAQRLPILRFDGSAFWALLQTEPTDDHLFKTEVTYLYEC